MTGSLVVRGKQSHALLQGELVAPHHWEQLCNLSGRIFASSMKNAGRKTDFFFFLQKKHDFVANILASWAHHQCLLLD